MQTLGSQQARIAIGGEGSLWVAGTSPETGDHNWVIGRYDLEGQPLVTVEVGEALSDTLQAIATGPEPGLHVLGRRDDPLEAEYYSTDPVVSRVDIDGNELWTSAIVLDGELLAVQSNLAADDSGNAYVVGRALYPGEEALPAQFSFVAKYDPNGEQQWFDLLFGSDTYSNSGRDVVPDGAGGVYALGDTAASLSGEPGAGLSDLWVAHYSADGTREWFTMIGGELRESVRDAVVDANGNLYIAAATDPQSGPPDVPLLLKLDPSGAQLWSIEGDLGATHLNALAMHPSGDFYAYYQTSGPDGVASDCTLARYDADGTLLSSRVLDVLGWVDTVLVRDDEVYLGDDRGSDGHFLVHLCPET